MSQKISLAPRLAKASALVEKVNDGTITVSPGWRSSSSAVSSRAAVHEVVSMTSCAPASSCRIVAARLLNGPDDEVWPPARLCSR